MKSIPSPLPRRFVSALASLVLPVALFAQVESAHHNEFPNLDRRVEAARIGGGGADAAAQNLARIARDVAVQSLRAKVKALRVDRDELLDTPSFIASANSHLTGPDGTGPAV